MARSKDVYTVLGLMCVSADYRDEFFRDSTMAAKKLVGSLSPDEIAQLDRLAGVGRSDRVEYVRKLRDELEGVCMAMNCPNFPCPDPDPFAA